MVRVTAVDGEQDEVEVEEVDEEEEDEEIEVEIIYQEEDGEEEDEELRAEIEAERAADNDAQKTFGGRVVRFFSQQIFHPSLRSGNLKLLMNFGLFFGTIWLSQNYGDLLAQ